METYRVRVQSGEASANGDIHLDCYIEKADGEDWLPVPNGHRTMVLDGAAVLAITAGSGTTQEKRAGLLELFRQEAASWGIDQSDDAYSQLYDLMPTGWPVTVAL